MTEEPFIDLAIFPFPTDQVSIRSLRARFSDHFDILDLSNPFSSIPGPGKRPDTILDELSAIVLLEREFAYLLLEYTRQGKGMPDDERCGYLESLGDGYVRIGISSGPAHSEQLIRSLESRILGYIRCRSNNK